MCETLVMKLLEFFNYILLNLGYVEFEKRFLIHPVLFNEVCIESVVNAIGQDGKSGLCGAKVPIEL